MSFSQKKKCMEESQRIIVLDTNIVYDWTGLRRTDREQSNLVQDFLSIDEQTFICVTAFSMFEIMRVEGIEAVNKIIHDKPLIILLSHDDLQDIELARSRTRKLIDEGGVMKIEGLLRSAVSRYIDKSFAILLQLLHVVSLYSIGLRLVQKGHNESDIVGDTALLIDWIRGPVNEEAQSLAKMYFEDANLRRHDFIKSSVRNLIGSFHCTLGLFEKAIVTGQSIYSLLQQPEMEMIPMEASVLKEAIRLHGKEASGVLLRGSTSEDTKLSYKYKIELATAYYLEDRIPTVNDIVDSWLMTCLPAASILSRDRRVIRFLCAADPKSYQLSVDYQKWITEKSNS